MEVAGSSEAVASVVSHPAHDCGPAATEPGDLPAHRLHQPVHRDAETVLREAIDLNFIGTVLPCQVFGQVMAVRGGSIVNISSMSVPRALTRVAGYGAGKAAMENFTRWLAVDLARRVGAGLRVNAIAPGFFVTSLNREMLTRPDGQPTERGETILRHTPMARFGDPSDLVSSLLWLCGPGARFITGVVVPVDGGFNAFGGV